MGLFRALNLLQAVEGQTVLGAELETILSSSLPQKAEFGAMLSTRHMSRRMAVNSITMTAINASSNAIQIVFEQTTELNAEPIKEIAKSLAAMTIASTTLASINAITGNAAGFKYFKESAHYETNILNTLATLIGHDPANYASLSVFILDPTPFGLIVINTKAMNALVASPSAMAIVTANSAPMQDIATDTNAMTITANSDISMHLIAQSPTALAEVTNDARIIVVSIPSALIILGSYHSAWQGILDSSTILDDNIYYLLINLNGLSSSNFADVDAIFADNAASSIVAQSHPSIQAIVAEANKTKYPGTTGAMDKLISSANLATILGSASAVEHIAEDEAIMTLLIQNSSAFSILLTSSAAKSAIFASTSLMSIMLASGSDSLTAVSALAVSKVVANDTVIGTFQSLGVSGKMILLTGVLGSIVATATNCSFDGDNEPVFTIGLTGTSLSSGPKAINKPYTNALWDIAAIAATAAATITFTYVDFN